MTAPVSRAGRGRLAIIAGEGRLPYDVAWAARRAGEEPLVIALENEADRDWSDFEHVALGIGDAAGLHRVLREKGIDRIVMSGAVKRRPDWREIRPSPRMIFRVPGIIRTLLGKGDDVVLRMVIDLIESGGYRVIGAHEVVPDLLAEPGSLTRAHPSRQDWADIEAARAAALALGRLDVGQGAVAVGGRVVALEGAEGTDQMLDRVTRLRAAGRISARRRGVLVKFCKPQQDERADLPSIGLSTVENAFSAGLAGIAVEVGRSLVLDRSEMVARADALGMFVLGIARDEREPPHGAG